MSQKPTLIFVPGAWHRAETWDRVRAQTDAKGYKSIVISLPSTHGDSELGFKEDMQATRDAIRAETKQGIDVVVVTHSYGGIVGVSAAKGFTLKSHSDSPESPDAVGHVIGFCLIATGFAASGMSMLEAGGGKPPPSWKVDEEKGLATIVVDPIDMLYHDLSDEDAKLWVSKLTDQSLAALATGGEFVYSGWMDAPNWFLVTLEDHALPGFLQQTFVEKARESGADVTKREISASHSPMLSKPEETAQFLIDAALDFVAKK